MPAVTFFLLVARKFLPGETVLLDSLLMNVAKGFFSDEPLIKVPSRKMVRHLMAFSEAADNNFQSFNF